MVSFGAPREMFAQAVINVLAEQHDLEPPSLVINGRLGKILGRAILSTNVVEINPQILYTSALDDTLRHEVAHFLAWKRGGSEHDEIWQQAAIELGARPVAVQDFSVEEPKANGFRYRYECGKGCIWFARRAKRRLERVNIICLAHQHGIQRITL